MTILEIQRTPTITAEMSAEAQSAPGGIHESCFRCYHVLSKMQDYLRRGVPSDVVLELIDEMQLARKKPDG